MLDQLTFRHQPASGEWLPLSCGLPQAPQQSGGSGAITFTLHLNNLERGRGCGQPRATAPPTDIPPLYPQEEMQSNVEVVHTYRQHIVNDMNPGNLHLFINAYNRCELPHGHVIAVYARRLVSAEGKG